LAYLTRWLSGDFSLAVMLDSWSFFWSWMSHDLFLAVGSDATLIAVFVGGGEGL
jgi:hypothetical protein